MDIFYYKDFDFPTFQKRYLKIAEHIEKGDLQSLDIKKIPEAGLFRVKLDYENRLLFRFGQISGKTCLLLLELVEHHDYSGSRFLRGKEIKKENLLPVA